MATEATKTDDGGQAFPSPAVEGHHPQQPGMTLRDWFAGQALVGILGSRNGFLVDVGTQTAPDWAYQVADGMIAHRAARKGSAELSESIDVLDLSTRAWNVLDRLGCKTVGDVTRLDEMDLICARGSGKTCRREIGRKLAQRGLSLAARKAVPQ